MRCLESGAIPSGEVHSNVLSLAMVEAAIRSAGEGRRVLIADILDDAHAEAIRTESDPQIGAVLESWSSVQDVVGQPAGVRPIRPNSRGPAR